MRALAIILLIAQPCFAQDAKDRFLKDYEEPAKKLKEQYKSIRATFEVSSVGDLTFKEEASAHFTFDHFRAESKSAFFTKEGKPLGRQEELAIVRNNQYGFVVAGKKIIRVSKNVDVRPLFELTAPYCDYAHRQTYFDLVKSGTATVISYSDRKLVYWSMRKDLETGKKETKAKTTVEFGPHWTAVSFITHNFDGDHEDSWVEKRYSYEPGPFLAGFTEWGYYEGILKLKRTATMKSFEQVRPLAPEAFRLTAFGLAEPEGITWPVAVPFYYYLFLGAAVLAALTFVLKRGAK